MAIVEHLIADTFGTHVGKYSKRIKVTQGGDTLAEAPLLHLRSIIVTSRGVSVSSDTLEVCSEKGIPIFFVDSIGKPYASLYAAGLNATILTRREQLRAYDDWRGQHVALQCALAKLHNQMATLKYISKNRKESHPDLYQELRLLADDIQDIAAKIESIEPMHIEDCRNPLMGYEGHAARLYWQGVGMLFPTVYAWQGRETRGAQDPINSLLNYGYGILYGQIERSIVLAGLDPYGGYLHADRSGKPSLVLDIIEEFRQVAIDRVVIGLLTRNYKIQQDDHGRLTKDLRRGFAEKILTHLEAPVRYHQKRYPLRVVIQYQARHLASFLRGNCQQYRPFEADW